MDWIETALEKRAQKGQLRRLREITPATSSWIELGGRRLVNFSSNDYLGLSAHPLLIQRGQEWAAAWGAGAGASRLVTGNHPGYGLVEAKLSRLKGTQAALVFNSGFQANVSILAALAQKSDLILADRLIHNSLLQGAQLSGACLKRFRHNDLDHLESLLADTKGRRFILAETIYSMDGDSPDLNRLADLAKRTGAFLILDEAHATGVTGQNGRGLGQGADLIMGTFGKGLGSFGAYLAGSQALMDYMVNFASGLIYTTALPPWNLGAIDAALDLLPGLEPERQHLQNMAERLRRGLKSQGWDYLNSTSQIVPILVGEETRCLKLAAHIEECGFLAMAIRPPTVPPGQARLRIALSASHQEEQIDGLLAALAKWKA